MRIRYFMPLALLLMALMTQIPRLRWQGLMASSRLKILLPPLLGLLLSLLLLPLLLLPSWRLAPLLDNWLRDPFLRSRGTHPPSWPRRHLMLSVLRH